MGLMILVAMVQQLSAVKLRYQLHNSLQGPPRSTFMGHHLDIMHVTSGTPSAFSSFSLLPRTFSPALWLLLFLFEIIIFLMFCVTPLQLLVFLLALL